MKDVIFQKANKPLGTFEQVKLWFSENHKNYGYETEMPVSADGLAVMVTSHRPGKTTDIEIFRDCLDIHLLMPKKSRRARTQN